ncbi:MAG: hypothetical protein HY953_01735 [Candidatus Rokubacteria bacterium]|nr:hypothetical protein [Candidatus Rokubacteria bacterium]
MTGAVVDTLAAQEFMREALAKITLDEMDRIADELETKHVRFRALLDPALGRPPGRDELRAIVRSVFATRRHAGEIVEQIGADRLAGRIHELLAGPAPFQARFQTFVDGLDPIPRHLRFDLASECLHYADPARYWLWTRWVWDPATRTGALPLVTMEELDLDGGSAGATYLRVGQAMAFVHETGQAAGFTRIGQGGFGADVYLACVYGVYVFTNIRIRMTQEFNRVIPPLPELCRRLLGVHRMEA